MLLALDIGNSQIAVGLCAASKWQAVWRLATDPNRSCDEYRIYLEELFLRQDVPPQVVAAAVISSVVPAVTQPLSQACAQLFGCDSLVVGPGVRTGMAVRYEPPGSLGPDRLVNALAARETWGAPVIVVDFGTATTFSVVDHRGDFVGGAIAPGVGTSADALADAAARLRHVGLQSRGQPPLIGKNTEDSIRSGVLYGHASLVSGLLQRMTEELDPEARDSIPVVATGGFSSLLAPMVRRINTTEPDLTLNGLLLVAQRNGVTP